MKKALGGLFLTTSSNVAADNSVTLARPNRIKLSDQEAELTIKTDWVEEEDGQIMSTLELTIEAIAPEVTAADDG